MIPLQCPCLNNSVKHMETKLAGGEEEETAPQQLNGMERQGDGTHMELQGPTTKCSEKKKKYSYRIVQLLQSINGRR